MSERASNPHRCARDSDWCDGVICQAPPRGSGMFPDCPNADPLGLKSTCDQRPACGCSVECRDHLARLEEKDDA